MTTSTTSSPTLTLSKYTTAHELPTLGSYSSSTPAPTGVTSTTISSSITSGAQTAHTTSHVATQVALTCKDMLINRKVKFIADSDVSGLGVLLGFAIPAYLVILFAFCAYRFGLLPENLLSWTDRKYFGANSRRVDTKWRRTLERATVIFSDQQILTGIAILITGYICLYPSTTAQPLASYHWQIIVYLAWMSTVVHLVALTILKDYLQKNKAALAFRITGMTILFGLLIGALVPTISLGWTFSTLYSGNDVNSWSVLPAHCFYTIVEQPDTVRHWIMNNGYPMEERVLETNLDAPFSFLLLGLSYIWKVAGLFESTRKPLRRWFRSSPQRLLERLATESAPTPRSRSLLQKIRFRIIAIFYVSFVATFEFLESFMASLWLVTLSLVWGSLQVFLPRQMAFPQLKKQDAVWGFGQILPLLFLLLPLFAVFEHFFGQPEEAHHEKLADDEEDNDSVSDQFEPIREHGYLLSTALLASTTQPTKYENGPTPPVEFLYSTRFFRGLMYLIQLCIASGAVAVFVIIALRCGNSYHLDPIGSDARKGLEHFMGLYDGGVFNILAAFVWIAVILIAYVLAGSFFSRAFR